MAPLPVGHGNGLATLVNVVFFFAAGQVTAWTQHMQSRSNPSWCVLVDFDGTIAPDDPTNRLLSHFADSAWRGGRASCGKLEQYLRAMHGAPSRITAGGA